MGSFVMSVAVDPYQTVCLGGPCDGSIVPLYPDGTVISKGYWVPIVEEKEVCVGQLNDYSRVMLRYGKTMLSAQYKFVDGKAMYIKEQR